MFDIPPGELLWALFGFAGESLFFMRFVYQWIASEKMGASVIPVQFWYLSIAGALMIFIYAIHIRDVVFAVGFAFALLIYIRNIMLIRKNPALPKDAHSRSFPHDIIKK